MIKMLVGLTLDKRIHEKSIRGLVDSRTHFYHTHRRVVGWNIMALTALIGYIVPSKNYRLIRTFKKRL